MSRKLRLKFSQTYAKTIFLIFLKEKGDKLSLLLIDMPRDCASHAPNRGGGWIHSNKVF